ncbi:MAG: biosynthetic-type acetolactate synthase large subunit [Chloroflexota bacterium]|nr:biosynthetic-type acetolactate synthase large subunit [Chloroflexota bacterium]MDE2885902.1 biosynthetic-type acetolactate synthase large subunit [Chloroflexota bacterium]
MRLNGAQMVCESLVREGTDIMFGLPGGAILPLYQTLPEYPQLRHILVRHEQNAGHAADGYARASGKVGVAVATSGPGATNLVTPLATAMMDSVPMVAITGQVPRAAIGRDAFQETDTTGITLPITKHNYLVMDTADIPRIMSEAFHIARTGRPGPVLIDLPRDVLTESADFDYPDHVDLPSYKPTMEGHGQMIKRAAQLIAESQRPLLMVGHGAIISGAFAEVREMAEKAQIPVITTLLGIGSFSGEHILSMGMPGMHGQAYNNWAIDRADLIIGVGMRFDDRVTGRLSAFAPQAKVIHIDIDPAEVGKNVRVTVPIVGDAKRVLHALAKQVEQVSRPEWIAELDALRAEHPLSSGQGNGLRPQHVVRELSSVTDGRAIVVTGVGQHQMWAAQHYVFKEPGSWITSGGLGTMGFEVPAAMGAAFAQPNRQVWSIAGDGGFQMTMSELATIVEHNVPVKFAILNNNNLGLVRQLQDLFYGGSRVASGYTGNPDFVKIAEAYGIWATHVTDEPQVRAAIEEAAAVDGPAIIDFHVEPEENVYPHVPAGESVFEMIESPAGREALSWLT